MGKKKFSEVCLIFFVVIGAIWLILEAIGWAIIFILSILALIIIYITIREIYWCIDPVAKKQYQERLEKKAEENRKIIENKQKE